MQLDLLNGAREGLRGRKSITMPEGWSNLYPRLAASTDPAIRENGIVLALIFGDPQAPN